MLNVAYNDHLLNDSHPGLCQRNWFLVYEVNDKKSVLFTIYL